MNPDFWEFQQAFPLNKVLKNGHENHQKSLNPGHPQNVRWHVPIIPRFMLSLRREGWHCNNWVTFLRETHTATCILIIADPSLTSFTKDFRMTAVMFRFQCQHVNVTVQPLEGNLLAVICRCCYEKNITSTALK